MDLTKVTAADLSKRIQKIDQELIEAQNYLNKLGRGKALPTEGLSKEAMRASTVEWMEKLKDEERQLNAELNRRGPPDMRDEETPPA